MQGISQAVNSKGELKQRAQQSHNLECRKSRVTRTPLQHNRREHQDPTNLTRRLKLRNQADD